MPNLYRIYYSDGNDRDELGRVSAQDIDQAVDYALKQYFQPDLEYEIDGDHEHLYLMIDSCRYCEHQDTELCEYCEISEYIEIALDNEAEPEYKTIFGVNEYADIENDITPEPFNPRLAAAWTDSPEKGISALILNTIEENPELEKGFTKELIEKSRKKVNQ